MNKLFCLIFLLIPILGLTQNLPDEVAKFSMLKKASKRHWDWEDAVFLYGLSEYGKNHANPEMRNKIYNYLKDYQSHYLKKGLPNINRSDACPSALTALTLARDWKDSSYLKNLTPIIYYLKNEPRNSLGTINHLGHAWFRFFYPPSIWVDSLMMIGVMSNELGHFYQDEGFLEFARKQPLIFSEKLQDENTSLYRHAWYEPSQKIIPASETYWLRGNGWALVSMVKILETTPKDHPNYAPTLEKIQKLSEELIKSQRENGFWGTIINLEKSYDETSGTALVGYGLIRAYKNKWMGSTAKDSALKAYQALLTKIKKKKKGYSLSGISGPTNPGPRLFYLMVPKMSDKGYGVGPFLMLARELENL